MTESPATKRTSGNPQLDTYYRWDEPESNITVCLQPEMIDRLQTDSRHGGNEIGGILLGTVERRDDRVLVVVDGFEDVSCGHRHGPAYVLSGAGASVFESSLDRARKLRDRSAVGYYRSHNRTGLFLSAADLSLIQRHFRAPESVFLLIKPLANGACTAGFFFWKDGQIQSEFTDSEVPLIPVASSPASEELAESVSCERSPAPPALLSTAEPTAIMTAALVESPDVSFRVIGSLVLAGVAIATSFAVITHRDSGALGDRNIPKPPAPVANVEPALTQKPETAAMPARRPGPVVREPVKIEPRHEVARVSAPVTTTPAAPLTAAVPRAAVVLPPAPHESITPPVSQSLPLPSDLALNKAPEVLAAAAIVPQVPVTPPPFAQNPRPLTAAPSQPEVVTDAKSNLAAAKAAHLSVGPRVIHQVTPAVPRGVATKITGGAQVDVEVAIDAKGRVTSARIASLKGPAAESLTIEALKAAQLFRFEPAQQDGRAISSVTVLTFRFAPGNK